MTPQEIRNITFDKVMRGYRAEDVDALLGQLADQIETLTADAKANEEKLYILAQKIEEYRKDEDNLKVAFLNAQRMGESVIKEAKQKADTILREAKIKAEDITGSAKDDAIEQELYFEKMKSEVTQFKKNVLGLYRQHIETLNTLPSDEEDALQPEETLPEFFDEQEEPAPQPEIAQQAEEDDFASPADATDNLIDSFPDISQLYAEAPAHTPQAEEQSRNEAEAPAPQQPEAPEQPAVPNGLFEGFQGIKFSD